MKTLSQKDKMMLLLLAAVVLIGGGFWFYVKPAKKELASQTTRAQDADANVQKLQAELTQLVAKAKPGAVATTNIADTLRLEKAYPTKPDLPATILQIESIAKKAGVSFDEGTPDKGTDFAGTTGTAFAIKVTGRYYNVQDFIYRMHNQVRVDPQGRLEINGRLFAVTKADLSLAGGSTGATSVTRSTPVEATITAVAFSRTPGAAGATGTTGAATQPTSTGGTAQ